MRAFLLYAVLGLCLSAPTWAVSEPQGELIFPAQDKHCHGSSLVQLPNGDLLACWFFGSGERSADDVLVQGARLGKGDTAWGPVFLMADTPGFPDCNPVLYVDNQKRLWLFWVSVRANKWEDCILMFRRAEDYQGADAPKWSWQGVIALKPEGDFADAIKQDFPKLHHDESLWGEYTPKYSEALLNAAHDPLKRQLGWMTRIHPLTLSNGRILLPLYNDGFNLSLVAISDDTGETWRASRPIVGLGPIQPTLVHRKDGSITAYMRDSGPLPPRALTATSTDNGDTWSIATDTEINNPGSSLEAIALQDGRWVMLFNDTEDGRHILTLALSDDEGKTWKWKRPVEQAEKGKGNYGYPSLIQTTDGKLHATYTFSETAKSIKHITVDPAWIMTTE